MSNLGITIFAARLFGPRDLGAFALGFAAYAVIAAASRALFLEPLLVRISDDVETRRREWQSALGSCLALGVLAGTAMVLVGWALDDALTPVLLVEGVLMPGLLVQDGWRYCFYSVRDPRRAALIDLLWTGALFAVVPAWAHFATSISLPALVGQWAGTATLAACVVSFKEGLWPNASYCYGWAKRNFDLGARYLLEALGGTGSFQLTVFLLGATSGLPAVAALRVGQTIFGPVNNVYSGIYTFAVPHGARLITKPQHARRRLNSFAKQITIALMIITFLWTLGAAVLPSTAGRAAFGASWSEGHKLIWLLGAASIGKSAASGAMIGLRSISAAHLSLVARISSLPLAIIGPVAGALSGGSAGMAAGMAMGSAVGAVIWWRSWVKALRASDFSRVGRSSVRGARGQDEALGPELEDASQPLSVLRAEDRTA